MLGVAQAQSPPEYQTIVLLSNLAEVSPDDPYWDHLSTFFESADHPLTVLINGDIVSSDLTGEGAGTDFTRIQKLKELFTQFPEVKVIILPGDRDWASSGRAGMKSVKKLGKIFSQSKNSNVKWILKKACPGPKEYDLGTNLKLIAIDTQWFNHPFHKPRPEDGDCKFTTLEEFIEEMEELLEENKGNNILIAGHYPIFSVGKSAGYYPPGKYLLPVPILSGIPVSYHQNVGSTQDITNHRFEEYRNKMTNLLIGQSSVVYASGHDRDLQILTQDQNFIINSGATLSGKFVAKSKDFPYTSSHPGFIALVYHAQGKVQARVYNYSGKGFSADQTVDLMESCCGKNSGLTPLNIAFIPCREELLVSQSVSGTYPDTGPATGGAEYAAKGLKTAFLGKHYRTSWATEIQVPILNMDQKFGGLTPYDRGGGRQTKSLKLKGGDGREYVFRSVNKDPIKAVPYEYRQSFIVDLARDQTSTQHPYGALVADPLLNQIDILHAHPRLFLLPSDPKLGPFQHEYGNLLGMIEERPVKPKKIEVPFANADRIRRSAALFRDLYEDHNVRIARDEFVRARVFDILVGDWGKHEDNWKWAGFKNGDGYLYRPIPRDRDHVFSRWDGVLPWLADREWAKSSGENFDYRIKGLRSLMWQARHLDRFLANEADEQVWISQAKLIQEQITDKNIEEAVAAMPEEVYRVSGKEIEYKLKSRRLDLEKYARDYYRMLAKEVDVVGSNLKEHFDVVRRADGMLEVTMYDRKDGRPGRNRLYHRVFDPAETKEVRLFGLDGQDRFEIRGEPKSPILLRVVGGGGRDTIIDKSASSSGKKILVYEKSAKAEIVLGKRGKRVKLSNPEDYEYDRTRFAYNTYFPNTLLSYNSDNGFQVKLGVSFTQQKYGKPEFSSKHSFSGKVTTEGNRALDYLGQFHQAIGGWDVLVRGHLGQPNDFANFFGFGNETSKVDSLFNQKFYRSRYNSYELGTGVGKEFWNLSHFGVSVTYENNEGSLEANTILEPDSVLILGKDPLNIVETKAVLNLDLRDSRNLPTRGIRILATQSYGIITTADQQNYAVSNGMLEFFTSAYRKNPITLGLRAGGGLSSGDLPFYKALTLGQTDYLRGFVRNRFSGDKSLFFSSGLRFQLGQSMTSLFPIRYGINGFYDLGKVFVNGESSTVWHKGYGGGFYIVPLEERFVFSVSAAFSQEESLLLLFSLGRVF